MILMVFAPIIAIVLTPTHRIADDDPINLLTLLPKHFGTWQEASRQVTQVVSPQRQAAIDETYTQTLSLSYVNAAGGRIMLSIAYTDEQTDVETIHYLEVCYPAQGFQFISTQKDILKTVFGDISVKRIRTVRGTRYEPLTYWVALVVSW